MIEIITLMVLTGVSLYYSGKSAIFLFDCLETSPALSESAFRWFFIRFMLYGNIALVGVLLFVATIILEKIVS